MIRALYSWLAVATQPFLRDKLRRRGVAEPGYLHAVEERFGVYAAPAQPGALWIHAVSLGETRAAAILVERLRQLKPDLRVLLTHGTATGRAEGEQLLRPGDLQAWLPWDTPQAVRRFLNHFQPAVGVLMETEIWPNLVAQCRERNIPVVMVNARLSERSLRTTRRLGLLSRPAYAALTAVWAQTESDAERLAQAGATVKGVFGNLKFDAAPDAAQLDQGARWRRVAGKPVVMFASSREGEEDDFLRVLEAHHATDGRAHQVQWLIVPRHPQRFEEVAELVARRGFSLSRRSAWGATPAPADVWVGDSLREMAMYYALADLALLGGSFAPLGGQNLIEAAACGCPIIIGPHTFNFAEAAQLAQAAGAALRVETMEAAVRTAVGLTGDLARLDSAKQSARNFTAAHHGAAEKTAHALLQIAQR
ncbi:MAG: 3-deoxy-D-manno-octulosonic acid transferase [Ramlibacter sp.]